MDTAKHEEPKSLSHKISALLRKGRVPLLVLAGITFAAVAAIAVVTAVGDSTKQAAALGMSGLTNDAQAWSKETDTIKKADLEKALVPALDALAAKWPKSVQAQQALAIKAEIAESKKDWAEVEKIWLDAATRLPGSFIAPVALQNAARAAEEQGADDRAKVHYMTFVDKYSGDSSGIAHAWFALGRIAEGTKDWPSALAAYDKIAANWPSSDWTKLAKDRIISMKSRGLVK